MIPPGTYRRSSSTEVPATPSDSTTCSTCPGPGVNLQTDLLGGDEPRPSRTRVTLQPNSTYIFRDERNLALGSIVFSTSATGRP